MGDTILYSSSNVGAILTDTRQGPSGAIASPTGTGIVLTLSGAIVGAALGGTAVGQVATWNGTQWVSAAGGVPVAPAAIFSASGPYAAPTQDITVPFDVSGGNVTMTLTGAPTPGVKLTLKDATKALGAHSLSFVCQGSAVADDPANLAGASTSTIVLGVANPNGYVAGGSVTLQWDPAIGSGGTWLSV